MTHEMCHCMSHIMQEIIADIETNWINIVYLCDIA